MVTRHAWPRTGPGRHAWPHMGFRSSVVERQPAGPATGQGDAVVTRN